MLREQPRRRARPSAPLATSAPLALLTPPKERPLTLARAALRSTAGTPPLTAPLARRRPHSPSRGTTVSRTRTATTIRTFVRGECIECSHLTMLIFVDAVLFVFRGYFFTGVPHRPPSFLSQPLPVAFSQTGMRRVPWGTGARPEQKLSVPQDPTALLPEFRSRRAAVSAPRGKAIVLLYSTLTVCSKSVWFTLVSNFPPLFRLPSQILLPSRLVVSHRQGVR